MYIAPTAQYEINVTIKSRSSACPCLTRTIYSVPGLIISVNSKSREHSEDGLKQLGNKINDLAIASLSNEEHILDVPFTLEEVKCAVMKLKSRKCCGPDGLSAEHLKWGGDSLHLWLLGIVNSIIDLEEIPPLFKLGSICPIFKGGGKDPLLINNYRGITVNSVLSKVLEILILSRFEPTLSEVDFPHLNQSAYRKHTGCTDAIFATQELIARCISEGSTVYMCLFDLQKAFDSIEFPVLYTGQTLLNRY